MHACHGDVTSGRRLLEMQTQPVSRGGGTASWGGVGIHWPGPRATMGVRGARAGGGGPSATTAASWGHHLGVCAHTWLVQRSWEFQEVLALGLPGGAAHSVGGSLPPPEPRASQEGCLSLHWTVDAWADFTVWPSA